MVKQNPVSGFVGGLLGCVGGREQAKQLYTIPLESALMPPPPAQPPNPPTPLRMRPPMSPRAAPHELMSVARAWTAEDERRSERFAHATGGPHAAPTNEQRREAETEHVWTREDGWDATTQEELHLGDLTPRLDERPRFDEPRPFDEEASLRDAFRADSPASPGFTPPLQWHTPQPPNVTKPRSSLRAERPNGTAKPRPASSSKPASRPGSPARSPSMSSLSSAGKRPLARKHAKTSGRGGGGGAGSKTSHSKSVSLAAGDAPAPTRGRPRQQASFLARG